MLWYLNIENTLYGGLEFSFALPVSVTFYEQICFSDRTSPSWYGNNRKLRKVRCSQRQTLRTADAAGGKSLSKSPAG